LFSDKSTQTEKAKGLLADQAEWLIADRDEGLLADQAEWLIADRDEGLLADRAEGLLAEQAFGHDPGFTSFVQMDTQVTEAMETIPPNEGIKVYRTLQTLAKAHCYKCDELCYNTCRICCRACHDDKCAFGCSRKDGQGFLCNICDESPILISSRESESNSKELSYLVDPDKNLCYNCNTECAHKCKKCKKPCHGPIIGCSRHDGDELTFICKICDLPSDLPINDLDLNERAFEGAFEPVKAFDCVRCKKMFPKLFNLQRHMNSRTACKKKWVNCLIDICCCANMF
jgi:hypothetical protein